jgi:hypothetical protein
MVGEPNPRYTGIPLMVTDFSPVGMLVVLASALSCETVTTFAGYPNAAQLLSTAGSPRSRVPGAAEFGQLVSCITAQLLGTAMAIWP